MLPIKSRHYNPLTYQFEDDGDGLNFYPTSYTPAVPETNENDVKIAKHKYNVAIQLAKMNYENSVEIAEINGWTERTKILSQALMTRTDKNEAESIDYGEETGILSWIFPKTKKTIVRLR